MDTLEEKTQVFTIRIWFERREIDRAPTLWRGIIRNERTNQQNFFREMQEVITFIEAAIKEAGGFHVQIEAPARNRWQLLRDRIRHIFSGSHLNQK